MLKLVDREHLGWYTEWNHVGLKTLGAEMAITAPKLENYSWFETSSSASSKLMESGSDVVPCKPRSHDSKHQRAQLACHEY